MRQFKYQYSDEGFCRTYFVYRTEKFKFVYCFQDEGDRFGGIQFYSCSEDGEPEYQTTPKDWMSVVPISNPKSDLEKRVNNFILKHQNEED